MTNICKLIIGFIFTASLPVSATIINDLSQRDWQASGDGLITLDTSTNLEWLDLSVTQGNSIRQTEAMSLFGNFRWATTLEIENLFDAVINGAGQRSANDAISVANAESFLLLFGTTFTFYNTRYSRGISRNSLVSPNRFGLGSISVTNKSSTKVIDPLTQCCWSDITYSNAVGSWLVRDATPVSEPSVLFLLSTGLFTLVLITRRNKK